jgi:hypothetical protein
VTYNPGMIVKVTDCEGRELIRRVVSDRGMRVLVCNEDEFLTAQRQRRLPTSVGFPKEDLAPVSSMDVVG